MVKRTAKILDLLYEFRSSAGQKFCHFYISRSFISVFKESDAESHPDPCNSSVKTYNLKYKYITL
jgi:hypothetical protein